MRYSYLSDFTTSYSCLNYLNFVDSEHKKLLFITNPITFAFTFQLFFANPHFWFLVLLIVWEESLHFNLKNKEYRDIWLFPYLLQLF